MRIDTSTRRVRHDIADGVRLMAFSLGCSILVVTILTVGARLA